MKICKLWGCKIMYKKKEITYILFLMIYLIMSILDLNTVLGEGSRSYIMSIIKYLCLIVILMKIVIFDIKSYSGKTYLKILLLVVLCFIVGKISNNRTFIQYLILIIGAYNIPFRKIAKSVLLAEGIAVFLIIVMSLANVIPNRVYERTNSDVARYSLGFKYATYPAIYIWYFTLLYLYIRNNKTKYWEYGILLALNVVMYILTDSRNEVICSVLIMLLVIVYNKIQSKKNKGILQLSAKWSMIVLTIISLLLSLNYSYKNETMREINKFSSDRLYLSKKALDNYGIKLFGNRIEWIGLSMIHFGNYNKKEFNYVDVSYLNILINYGVIMLLLILYAFYKITKNEIKKGNSFICCFILVIAIHSFINPQLFQITYNIFILLFVDLIIAPEKKCKDNKEIAIIEEGKQ